MHLRSLPLIAILAAVVHATASPVRAEIELGYGSRVLSAAEVLDLCVPDDRGELMLDLPGAKPWVLDMEVSTDADASELHVVAPLAAAAAWRQIDPRFSARIPVTIVVLPAPRVGLPLSSAEDGVIFLSPGGAPYTSRQVAFLVAHEFGHCVHRALMDDESPMWDQYRSLRGIEDEAIYHNWAAHGSRPREIIAEDFRFLFGGSDANYSGGIENENLPLPTRVAGLREFFERLIDPTAAAIDVAPNVRVSPQPSRGRVTIQIRGAGAGATRRVSIVDVTGRFVRRLEEGITTPARFTEFVWDGRADGGARAPSGVYYVRLEPAPRVEQAEAEPRRVVLIR